MSEKLPLINKLPGLLVTPERFGQLALPPVIETPLPEIARVYKMPLPPYRNSQAGNGA